MKNILNSIIIANDGGLYEIQLASGVIYQGEVFGASDCLILKTDHTDRRIYINFDYIMSVRKA